MLWELSSPLVHLRWFMYKLGREDRWFGRVRGGGGACNAWRDKAGESGTSACHQLARATE